MVCSLHCCLVEALQELCVGCVLQDSALRLTGTSSPHQEHAEASKAGVLFPAIWLILHCFFVGFFPHSLLVSGTYQSLCFSYVKFLKHNLMDPFPGWGSLLGFRDFLGLGQGKLYRVEIRQLSVGYCGSCLGSFLFLFLKFLKFYVF